MNRHRAGLLGLSLLGALLICAIAAQSAFATASTRTTAVTCAPEVKNQGAFKDAHCDETEPLKEGAFKHVAISNGTETEIETTNKNVTENTTTHEPAVLKGEVLGGKLELACTSVTGKGKITNSEPSEKVHKITGSISPEYSECTIKQPEKCTVKGAIKATASFEGVEELDGEEENMGLEFKGTLEPVKGIFSEFVLEGAECGLKGTTVRVKGSMIGTCGPTTTSAQNRKECGATTVSTPAKEMEKGLTVGGNPAEFTNITTTKMVGGNPISLTTTPTEDC